MSEYYLMLTCVKHFSVLISYLHNFFEGVKNHISMGPSLWVLVQQVIIAICHVKQFNDCSVHLVMTGTDMFYKHYKVSFIIHFCHMKLAASMTV